MFYQWPPSGYLAFNPTFRRNSKNYQLVQIQQNGCKSSKTKYILFRPRGQKIQVNLEENGVIYNSNENGQPDDQSKISKLGQIFNEHPDINKRTYTFMGVYLDEYLSFDTHCIKICNKLAKSNFIISRVKNILSPLSLKTLYFALVCTPTSPLLPTNL